MPTGEKLEVVEKVVENPDSISIKHTIDTNVELDTHVISPLKYFEARSRFNDESDRHTTVLLILNQQINILPDLFAKLWNNATLKVCADGGLNRLRDYDSTSSAYIPDYVVGDLDSAKKENIEHYQSLGTKKILQSSQYYTDFMKALSLINTFFNFPDIISDINHLDTVDALEKLEEERSAESGTKVKALKIVVLGGVGGRFDQTMATINQIWNLSSRRPHLQFVILNPEHTEIIVLLKPGFNFVAYPRFTPQEETEVFGIITEKSRPGLRNVGVLPILSDAVITTYGLKWDVENWRTGLTTKMSSSNLQVGKEGFIIWTNKHLFVDFEL
ncbi:hypothetical protein PICMEDRAFT_74654 [Pichia membranifaciens NRRL Y-2026]|uniref:Thiamine pyrophosphokinase n=1 Tax=Pichia membranifaciens NRRL Y-2026 TaxID=763406 RepID=A0A1E3NGD8_9ASCO|nr:hypothetical protein PICMEDRAFT_74654 [Pichia membranifaciens NRRL Y-2026]ODQ44413.1 hypothetical protein PICMEDRAFT_74654 [Pichia membranifaciens NRRL Y-2026]